MTTNIDTCCLCGLSRPSGTFHTCNSTLQTGYLQVGDPQQVGYIQVGDPQPQPPSVLTIYIPPCEKCASYEKVIAGYHTVVRNLLADQTNLRSKVKATEPEEAFRMGWRMRAEYKGETSERWAEDAAWRQYRERNTP